MLIESNFYSFISYFLFFNSINCRNIDERRETEWAVLSLPQNQNNNYKRRIISNILIHIRYAN